MKVAVLAMAMVASGWAGAEAAAAYKMPVVTMYHTRFLGNNPHVYNETAKKWQAKFDLSSGNTASLLGSLQYAQEEVIPEDALAEPCVRRSNANLIVFYEVQMVQPNAALAYYNNSPPAYETPFEYGRYYAIDGGAVTPGQNWGPQLWNGSYASQKLTQEKFGNFSSKPLKDDGTVGMDNPPLGPYIGAWKFEGIKAKYPKNWWFALPADCTTNTFAYKKAPICQGLKNGLCKGAYGTPEGTPDGITCTWNYRTMGLIDINGLVGMYDIVDPQTGKPKYKSDNATADYMKFCMDKENEYKGVFFSRQCNGDVCSTTGGFKFWENASDPEANTRRAELAIEYYSNTTLHPNNIPMIDAATLRKKNPKCYETTLACSKVKCFRNDQQICEKCTDNTPPGLCETVPAGFQYPSLTIPTVPQPEKPKDKPTGGNGDSASDSDSSSDSGDGSGSGAKSGAESVSVLGAVMVLVAATAMQAAL